MGASRLHNLRRLRPMPVRGVSEPAAPALLLALRQRVSLLPGVRRGHPQLHVLCQGTVT